MRHETLTAPDGSEMVVLTRADYDKLIAASGEDALDIRSADRAAAHPARYPADVVDAILGGASPIAAWRAHRKMSQVALASAAAVSQTAIARLETKRNGISFGHGRPETRRAIAHALDVPVEALEPLED